MLQLRLLALFTLAFAAAVPAPAASPESQAVGAADRAAIIDEVLAALRDAYIFPDTARQMEEHVRGRQKSGAYDRLTTLEAFTEALTADLRSISHDLHLGVGLNPEPPPQQAGGPSEEEMQARMAEMMRWENYCFRKVEKLAGNIGYLKLDCFAPADLGGATAAAAMAFLAGTDALIFDLRDNLGGEASMVELLSSYLFSGKTHLNSFYTRRADETEETWTYAWVPGTRRPGVPVFVLTSGRTFSAAESFAYELQSLKRATVVGETTAGAAHRVDLYQVQGYPLVVTVPFRRPVSPITGTSWEGTGVKPDVAAPAPEALAAAHARALSVVAEKAGDHPMWKAMLELAHAVVEDRRHPVSLSAAELQAFAGTYGPRTVTVEGGALGYQRDDEPKLRLIPVGGDRFVASDREDLRFRFERDASGRVVALVVLYAQGGEDRRARGE